MQRKLILYIAMSLDGYIAKPGDNLDFLSVVAQEGEDYGYSAFTDTIDTVILGRKTYDWVMAHADAFPHAGKEAYVITRTKKSPVGKTHFYNGDIQELVAQLKAQPGKNIFCDGGAQVVNLLLKQKLIDELIISVLPILLGEGTRLFESARPEQALKLAGSRHYSSGLVQLHYTTIV